LLESDIKFLREQVSTKDAQISQANILTQGLQRLIAGLTGTPDPSASPDTTEKIAVVSHAANSEHTTGHQ